MVFATAGKADLATGKGFPRLILSLTKGRDGGGEIAAVVSFRTWPRDTVAPAGGGTHNFPMKILVSLLVSVGFLWGVYILYLKRIPPAAEGTEATQAISITGVKMDMLQIAKAERAAIGTESHCMSLEELQSSGSMSLSRTERDGYSYSVECSGNDFTVTARHAPAPAGSSARYPEFTMDQTMQVRQLP